MSVFHPFLKIFLVLSPFLLDPDPYCFCLDPDPYQISPWIQIRIRNEFIHILDPDSDPYQNDTDPPHCSPWHRWAWLQHIIDTAESVTFFFKLIRNICLNLKCFSLWILGKIELESWNISFRLCGLTVMLMTPKSITPQCHWHCRVFCTRDYLRKLGTICKNTVLQHMNNAR